MKPIETVFLGKCDYFGKEAEAFREEFETHCRFILVTNERTFILLEYPKIN